MPSFNNTVRITKNFLPIITTVSAIFAVFANLWLFSQLSPLLQTDAVIIQRVEAIEKSNIVPREELNAKFESINTQLELIEKNNQERYENLLYQIRNK